MSSGSLEVAPPILEPSYAATQALFDERLEEHRPTVVSVLCSAASREVVLIVPAHAYKKGIPDNLPWQFPQGGIEAGESPSDAFTREIQEEVGVRPAHLRSIHGLSQRDEIITGGYPRDGKLSKQYFSLGSLLETAVPLRPQPGEVAIAQWWPIDHAANVLDKNPRTAKARRMVHWLAAMADIIDTSR
jgi:8-oxo-dGTP pyrophosphatase MutT (NUDIX family)